MLAWTAKPSPPHQSLGHAAPDGRLEHLAQQVAVSEMSVRVPGEREMVGHGAVQPQSTEPAKREDLQELEPIEDKRNQGESCDD
jgi:hypothetical protein